MYIGFYSHHKAYNNNIILTQKEAAVGDDLHYPFVLLADRLKEMGHRAATIDTDNLQSFDAVVFIEFPGLDNKYFKKCIASNITNIYLVLLESPLVKPDNYDIKNHIHFKKIFTWADNLVDNKKYFKINYSHNLAAKFLNQSTKREKLCTLIASNKNGRFAKELYSERRKAIRWFEKNHPDDFDLYGKNWDRYNFGGNFLGFKLARLNRLTFLTKLLSPHYFSYKGSVASKNETYRKYTFSICYENLQGVTGYITEKIFDCFLAGCVPIYLGAPNITDHIPANTFIDKRNFPTYEKLYDYIKNMPEHEYLDYLEAIRHFLQSKAAYPFSAQYFADTVINEILS